MATPPIPPSPHGFYSEIHQNQPLPQDLHTHLTTLVDHLNHMENGLKAPDAHRLANDLEHYDHLHTDFLKKLNHNSNRGFEKKIKDTFESAHNRFAHKLKEIVDDHGTSLRDILLSFERDKALHFLERLHGSHAHQELRDAIRAFSHEITMNLLT